MEVSTLEAGETHDGGGGADDDAETVQQHLECMGCLLSLVRGVLRGPVLQ